MDSQNSGQAPPTNPSEMYVAPPSPPVPKKFSFSPKIILLILVILIAVIIGSGLYLSQSSNPKEVAKITPTPLPTEASAKAGDPTEAWKTFNDAEAGVSFKYPQDYSLETRGADNILVSLISPLNTIRKGQEGLEKNELKIEILLPEATSLSLEQIIDSAKKETNEHGSDPLRFEIKDIIIGGIKAKILTTQYSSVYYVVKNNRLVRIIKYPAVTSRQSELDQILSTFKFTDQLPDDGNSVLLPIPKNWIKYVASCASLANNVEIYYPDGWKPKEFGNITDVLNPDSQECQAMFGYPVQPQSYQAPTEGELAVFKVQTFIDGESLDQRVKIISNQHPKSKSVSKVTVNGTTWSKVEYDQYQTWLSTKVQDRFIEIYLINATTRIGDNFDQLVNLKNYDLINTGLLNRIKILTK